jgi:hypothetical protein
MYRGITIQNIARQNKKSYLFLCQHGGSIKTARRMLVDLLTPDLEGRKQKIIKERRKKLDDFLVMMNKDQNLIIRLGGDEFTRDNIGGKIDGIMEIMIDIVKIGGIEERKFVDTYIDWVVKSYTRHTIQNLDDAPMVKDAIIKFDSLKKNHMLVGDHENINNIYGFDDIEFDEIVFDDIKKDNRIVHIVHKGLKNIIVGYHDKLEEIVRIKEEEDIKKRIQKEIEAKGKSDGAFLFETEHVSVYNPKTMDQSRYYGRSTKWCTISNDNQKNMFHHYNDQGPLFIIVPKNTNRPNEKYQAHIVTGELKKDNDKRVRWKWLLDVRFVMDNVLKEWVKSIWIKPPTTKDGLNVKSDLDLFFADDVNSIIFDDGFNLHIDKYNLPKGIKSIVFGAAFNKKINNLPETLELIAFGHDYDSGSTQSYHGVDIGIKEDEEVKEKDEVKEEDVVKEEDEGEDEVVVAAAMIRRANINESAFNQSLDKLPNSVKYIVFNKNSLFNQPINRLPRSSEYVILGRFYSNKIIKSSNNRAEILKKI